MHRGGYNECQQTARIHWRVPVFLSRTCLQPSALFPLHTIVKSNFRSTAAEQPKFLWSCEKCIFLRVLHVFNLTTTELISRSLRRSKKLGKQELLTSQVTAFKIGILFRRICTFSVTHHLKDALFSILNQF